MTMRIMGGGVAADVFETRFEDSWHLMWLD
jgi:hypothetical protein